MTKLQKKRVYDEAEKSDGYRILVDRLWPRGIKKEELPYELWAKSITPSDGLRKSFNHEEDKFETFKKEYLYELAENEEAAAFIEAVKEQLKEQNVTLLYAAKDREINQAAVLLDWLDEQLQKEN